MKLFRDLPIQQKTLVMTLSICGAVLCIAIAVLFTFQVLNFRANYQRDLDTVAVIIANNGTAALAFKDDKAATELVDSLRAKPSILTASLLLPDGSMFVHYGRPENAAKLAQFPPAGQQLFVGGDLLLTQPVELKGERLGTLYIRADYHRTFLELLHVYGLVILGIVAASIGLAAFLSAKLGKSITQPVLILAQAAQIVGEKKDYSVRVPASSQGDELGQLTRAFNEMLSRIQSQDAALSLSQQKMEALIHSIDGIVWERTADAHKFTFVSRQSEEILGYAPALWCEKEDFWESKLHPQDAAKARQTNREMAARGQPYSYEYRMLAADDRTVWIRESGTVLMENGKPIAMRGIFQDITQSKLDAQNLDKLNRQLMDTSRQAGMAEVATGVLHNVGNILNSVSVSATLAGDKLRQSKIGNLREATALLNEQNGHLVEFLTNDPGGKVLPTYLSAMADQIAGEQANLLTEISSINQNVEHIKEIVAMQQSYAKVSGVYENLSVAGLVEDALRMNIAAFDRHSIEVIKEFDENMPHASVDRHKILQILINLLRNAKHAMDHRPASERQMRIRLCMASPDRVKISIKDNGIGIAPENLTKIFNHGFTTKKDGHGFGLHSGANAAKEMGGSLSAHSHGLGHGAEFTLELPTAVPGRKEGEQTTTAVSL
ncbi:MAG TPA: PAS domain-containing protein [Verrucomicrobiae bacterium]|jgi:PAS domain S-box-containing protein|nr:PAS domain-containing protein [Verrucomicrobiae bacterium]